MQDLYPLTIVADRYSGTYSGGLYVAWNLHVEDVPIGPDSDDVSCFEFWLENEIPCGLGDTPEAAHADLAEKLGFGR